MSGPSLDPDGVARCYSSFGWPSASALTWKSQTSYLGVAVFDDVGFHPHRTLFMFVNSMKTSVIEVDACRFAFVVIFSHCVISHSV